VGEAIASEDKKAIEDVACDLVRAPLSLKKAGLVTSVTARPRGRVVDHGETKKRYGS
jgi:hypothetical protein